MFSGVQNSAIRLLVLCRFAVASNNNVFLCRWFKHLSDATEAYQIKEGKPKQSDHNNETEEETVQELPPTSSREATATERAEAVVSGETQSNAEGGEPATEEANGGGDVSSSEDDKEKRLSQTDGDGSCSSNALSAGELIYFVLL